MKKILVWSMTALTVIGIILFASAAIFYYQTTKNVNFSKETLITLNAQTELLDDHNQRIKQLQITHKDNLNIDQIPTHLKNAFISIEDKDFYKHHGLNYKRMIKAMYNNIRKGSFAEGASTISQQLIKNTHLTNQKTITRKLKEIALTAKLEQEFSKDEILEIYLNIIYFGENAYGISKASQVYFNKPVQDLTLGECAMLAGMIKSPAYYSPRYQYEHSIARRNLVLKEMLKDEKITQDQYNLAIAEQPTINMQDDHIGYSRLYYKGVMLDACQILEKTENEIAVGGYKIYTYYDDQAQQILYQNMHSHQYDIPNQHGHVADGLAIFLDNKTGGVKAYAGRSNYDLTNFKRQPGSAIKPILVYAPALEKGIIAPDSYILDETITVDNYTPHNLGYQEHGYVTAKYAVAKSLNIPAVKLMQCIGIEECKSFANQAGIEFSPQDKGYAIALGGFTDGTTLKDLTNSYLPFSRNGQYIKSSFIKKITTKNDIVIYQNHQESKNVMGDDSAYLMTDMLIEGVKSGTSRKLSQLPFAIAGKTGTVAIPGSNNNSDAISIAYTTQDTMGVWYGNYSNQKEYTLPSNNNGGTMATAFIANCFEQYYTTPPDNFTIPNSVSTIHIDQTVYDDQHVIQVAPEYLADRYTLSIPVATRYIDSIPTSNYETEEKLQANFTNNQVTIQFQANKMFQYEIHKINKNNKDTIIEIVDEKDNIVTLFDNNIEYDDIYHYYLVKKSNNTTISKSNQITIKIPKKETNMKKIINQPTVSDFSFLFQ